MSGQAPDYLFGQSAEETERLRLQAEMFAPYTARLLADAGISSGMRFSTSEPGLAMWLCSQPISWAKREPSLGLISTRRWWRPLEPESLRPALTTFHLS